MQHFQTKNKSKGVNTCEYIVLHHTGTKENTKNGLIETFKGNRDRKVSAHYLIDEEGKVYKFGEHKDILWHAGFSKWDGKSDLNRFAIGIEIIGPLSNGEFTNMQKITLKHLLREIVSKENIKVKNIVRHKDISPGRKTDLADIFWNKSYDSYNDYITSIFQTMGEYEKQYKNKYGQGTIYNDIEGALNKLDVDREYFFFNLIGLERIKNG